MSPNLCTWLRRKWRPSGETRPQGTTSRDQDPQLDPGSFSPLLGEAAVGKTTTGEPRPQPDLKSGPTSERQPQETASRGPNSQPDPGSRSSLFGDAPLRATTVGPPNLQLEPILFPFFGETLPQGTTPGGSNLRPDPTSSSPSLGETPLREKTTGGPNLEQDHGLSSLFDDTEPQEISPAWPNPQPDHKRTLSNNETRPQETTIRWLNPRPDLNAPQEDTPAPPYSISDPRGALPTQGTIPSGPSPRPDSSSQEDTPANTRPDSSAQENNLPTPSTTLNPRRTTSHNTTHRRQWVGKKNATLETLRAHNPAIRTPRADSHILTPPPQKTTPKAVADAAACRAVIGIRRAFDERDPRMVAARTAQAIAVATSTSRDYPAFVAAVIAAESFALLSMEDSSYQIHISNDKLKDRYKHAQRIATDAAGAAPSNVNGTCAPQIWQWPQRGSTFWGTLFVIGFDWALVTVLWWAVKVVPAWILKVFTVALLMGLA